jgi:hypothetical protein
MAHELGVSEVTVQRVLQRIAGTVSGDNATGRTSVFPELACQSRSSLPIPSATRIERCAEVFKAAASIRILGND